MLREQEQQRERERFYSDSQSLDVITGFTEQSHMDSMCVNT